ncbi:MAG: type IV toxin-antitoxin system AbiEi family antitoxin domain-containing protein [Actinobacteria bacterium]|nr:type IV toxin-antitoxin system AbiEi family antitoxin domain-containing protein [Actinomycetota bacterium]
MPSTPHAPLSALVADAHRQHGLFTTAQADAVGMHRSMLERRLRTGELVAVDHGVYRSALTPPSWHQRLAAACLAGPAVASHRSAAALWHMPIGEEHPLEVTALRHRRRFTTDVTWHESYLLDDDQVTLIDGVPVTRAARTVIDLAGVVDHTRLVRAVDDVLRRRLASTASLQSLLQRLGPLRRGVPAMRAVLDARSGPVPESDLETQFLLLIEAHGLPTPVPQHMVRSPDGRSFRIDFAYPDALVGIELLGAEFHSGPDQWRSDTARLTVLASLGWLMLSFAYEQVVRQAPLVVRAVERALAR